MKLKGWMAVGALVSLSAVAADSELVREFLRRDEIKFTPEQGVVLNFLNTLKFPVAKIAKLEVLGDGDVFYLSDRDDNVCMGQITRSMLRCKNSIGISTVTFTGDSD